MRNNPLLAHLLRKSAPPALWLTVVFSAAVMAWAISTMQPGLAAMQAKSASTAASALPEYHVSMFFAALLVLLGASVAVAVNAAVFTSRHAQLDNLKMLKLANISRAQMAWGYSLAALHRMRMLVAMAAGLIPAFAIGMTELGLMFYQIVHPQCSIGPCSDIFAAPTFDTAHGLLTNGLVAAGLLGLSPMGAAVGAVAALTWRQAAVSAGIGVAGVTLALAAYAALIGPTSGISLPAALAAMAAPYVLAWGIITLAGRPG